MKRAIRYLTASVLAAFLLMGIIGQEAAAAEVADEAVLAVIGQLEAIDTLQQMQDKRSTYTEAAAYETYVSAMFSARIAARTAYDELTASQKAQIDDTLTARLTDELETVFYQPTMAVTPRGDAYPYEVIFANRTMYEMGHHVSGEMPCTILLVDTEQSGSSWTPNGLYEYGRSNYEVTYCCDAVAPVNGGTHYRRINLENSGYYSRSAAEHIRTIVQRSYPYLTLEEMKEQLVEDGLSRSFVDTLTRGDIISAVQMAIWAYSNSDSQGMSEYAGTIEMTDNRVFRNPLHDYTNELWSWWDTGNSAPGIYDEQAAYRVNALVYHLCRLPGTEADADQVVISDIEITRAELLANSTDVYSLGLYIYLNSGGGQDDELTITVTSYHENGDGTTTITGRTRQKVSGEKKYGMFVNAGFGDTVTVTVEGTQQLSKGVYFYEPEGGKLASQCLVGMAQGETAVMVERSFTFAEDTQKGLRIHKTDVATGLPLSDITFTVYRVETEAGEVLNDKPTAEEITRFVVEENKVGAVTTDTTGYAVITLEDGVYLVVEELNADKVKRPVDPFYLYIPMPQEVENGAETQIEYIDVVSVYPKNETTDEPDDPPDPPVPENVTGSFRVVKYDRDDETRLLADARFRVYRPATLNDTETVTITCGGVQYAVVPVTVDGKALILTTGEDGTAVSPQLTCGAYFLVESRAPAGYHLLEESVCVTVTSGAAAAEAQVVRIANESGVLLPETGGVGTTWLLVIGAVLVLTALVLLVARRRMKDDE